MPQKTNTIIIYFIAILKEVTSNMSRLTIIVTALALVGCNAFAPSMNQNVRSTELFATSIRKLNQGH